jgi:tetratricopeptide (TPR) repeat protein
MSFLNVRYLLVTGLLIAGVCLPARATSWEVKVTCPIDGTKIRARLPARLYGRSVTLDLRSLGIPVDHLVSGIVQCPECGFAAHASQYGDNDDIHPEELRQALRELKTPRMFFRYDAAILVEQLTNRDLQRIARLTLANKWLADDTGEPDVIRKRTALALTAHREALKLKQLPIPERSITEYATGELLRQSGQRREAVEWFDRALNGASFIPPFMIWKQRMLALHAGEVTPDFIKSISEFSPDRKVAAVALLRDSELPEAVGRIEEICLHGPEELREFAFMMLMQPAPQKQHLPIFLKAIGSRDFRTAQAGARAVALLRAREAAPLLAQALRDPPQNAAYRLLAALSVLATEKEIAALERQVELSGYTPAIVRGLVNTRSPKAIPAVLRIIERNGFSSQRFLFRDESGFETLEAATQIDGLVDQLPDLRMAKADSRLAGFKVLLLGVAKQPHATAQLVAALDRGQPLALSAAIELVRRHDSRGKPLFLEQLREIKRMDSGSWQLCLPLLKPSDVGAIQRALQQERDARQQSIKFRRQLLIDAETDEDRARAKQRLDQLVNRENWWMASWLLLLGATGHAGAREILLPFLGDPNWQAREGAVLGLERVYNSAVGDRFVEMLNREASPRVTLAIFEVLARSGDRSRLAAVVDAGHEPMRVPTRLAWIAAVRALDGLDQIRPKLMSLSESPNRKLAAAAALQDE